MSLYTLTGDFLKIQELAESSESAEVFADTLESIEMAIEDKVENTAKVIRNLESQVVALKDEEKRFSERRKPIENSIKRLKENLYTSMIVTGKRKVEAGTFKVSIAKNPASLSVDESLLPHEFFVPQPPKVDNALVKSALKDGVDVPGASLVQGEGVRIK